MNPFWIFLTFLLVQRVSELLLAKRNERVARVKGAVEYDEKGYKVIVLMHIFFFISLISEYILLARTLSNFWVPLLILFIIAQILRYWAISTLGYYWNTKILVTPNTSPIRTGPYKYLNHPNYLSVILEIAVIPLIFSCYITSMIFTLLNLGLLKRRMRIEEQALSTMKARNIVP
jgi:methyltransferase